MKIFRREDFAYHKVKVVFWQTDELDQPAIITERYEKAFSAANIAKEQAFYASELTFSVRLIEPESGRSAAVTFALAPDDSFPKVFEKAVADAFEPELAARTQNLTGAAERKKAVKRFTDALQAEVEVEAPALRAGRRIHPVR